MKNIIENNHECQAKSQMLSNRTRNVYNKA